MAYDVFLCAIEGMNRHPTHPTAQDPNPGLSGGPKPLMPKSNQALLHEGNKVDIHQMAALMALTTIATLPFTLADHRSLVVQRNQDAAIVRTDQQSPLRQTVVWTT